MAKAFQGLGFISGTNAERLAHTVGVAEAGTQWFETDTSAVYVWSGSAWFQSIYSGLTPAGGDLTGSYPNPTITNITNAPIHNSNTTLSFRTSSTERMGIDASGVITTPNLVQRDTGWTNMNLTAYDASWTTGGGQYRKMPDGLVVFRGLVKIANSGVFFTMPVGYRPNGITNTLHGCPASGGIARIDAYSNGQLIASGSQAGSVNMLGWVSLGGIIYWAG
jgi:hypothetical protein